LTAAGGGGGGAGVDDLEPLREITASGRANLQNLVIGNLAQHWMFLPTFGAGVPDDASLVVKPNDVLLAAAGRWVNVSSTPTVKFCTMLRNCKGAYHKRVRCLAYEVLGDGGGGEFYLGAAVLGDDGGTIFTPTGGSPSWIRQYTGAIHCEWFGVLGLDNAGYAHNNRVRFNAMWLAYGGAAKHFIIGGAVLHVDSDIGEMGADASNPKCLILDNGSGSTLSGMGRGCEIRYSGVQPPNTSTFPAATLAVVKAQTMIQCTISNIVINGGNGLAGRAHVGLWIKDECQFNEVHEVVIANAAGRALLVGRGDGLATIVDGNSFTKCNFGNSGIFGYDPGTGRGGVLISDFNTNNTTIKESIIAVNGPTDGYLPFPGVHSTLGEGGIELDHFPRGNLFVNNQMYNNSGAEILLTNAFASEVHWFATGAIESFHCPVLKMKIATGGVANTGMVGVTGLVVTYGFRQVYLAFTFAANTFTESAYTDGHGKTNGIAFTLATTNGVTTPGTLPTGFNATTTYYVVNATKYTYQLALTPGGTPVTGSGGSGICYSFVASFSRPFTYDSGSQTFTLPGPAHGYVVDDVITMATVGGTLPPGTPGYNATIGYYVVAVTGGANGTVQLSGTKGGAVIATTSGNGSGSNWVRRPYKIIDDQSGCGLYLRMCEFNGPSGGPSNAAGYPGTDPGAQVYIAKDASPGAGGAYTLDLGDNSVRFYGGARERVGTQIALVGAPIDGGVSATAPIVNRRRYFEPLTNVTPVIGTDLMMLQRASDHAIVTCTKAAVVGGEAIQPASVTTTGAIHGATNITADGYVYSNSVSLAAFGQYGAATTYSGVWCNGATPGGSQFSFLSNNSNTIINAQATLSIDIAFNSLISMTNVGGLKLGFYTGSGGVLQATRAGQITDSTGSAATGAAVDVTTTGLADPTKCNDNFHRILAKLNAIEAMLSAAGGGIGVSA